MKVFMLMNIIANFGNNGCILTSIMNIRNCCNKIGSLIVLDNSTNG